MSKWRIKEITHYLGTEKESKEYLVEKRFLGFLWWYDPFEDGMYSDGYFASFDAALESVTDLMRYRKTKKIIWEK